MATDGWEDGYAGSTAASLIDDKAVRELKSVRERLVQGGHLIASNIAVGAATENADGKHCVGVEPQTDQTDAGYLTVAWSRDGATKRIRTYGSLHSTKPNRTSFPGDLEHDDPAGVLLLRGLAQGAFLRASIYDALPATGYITQVIYKVPAGSGARSLKRIMLVAGTRPTSASLTVDVRKLTAPILDSVNRYVDGSSASLITLSLTNASGNFSAETTGSFALAADDEIVLKWTAVNGAQDVTVLLQVE